MRNSRSDSVPSGALWLWPILLGFLALQLVYNWAIPLGEGPDEPGHLAYALFLAAERRLPVQREAPEPSDVPGEGHQPPLAYALAAPAVAWLPADQRQILLTANPRFLWAGGDEPGAFMRGSRELWPWPPFSVAWHLARAVSGLCGALAVAFTWLAARRVQPATPAFAALAAVLVALNPQLLFTSALVSNDALLAALGAALLWWCLKAEEPRTENREPRTGDARMLAWAVGAGMLFGLALLTKQSALLLGPLLLWGGWRAAGGRWRRFVGVTLGWGGTALLVAGWWFVRNLGLYGDLFGLAVFQSEFATQPFAWGDPAAWGGALAQLFASFWARFGWLSLRPPEWTLWAYGLLCLAAGGGWLRVMFRRDRAAMAQGGLLSAPLIALGMGLAWTLAFAATAGLVAWQGRMLFPALAAIALLLARGLFALAPARWLDRGPAAALVLGPAVPLLCLALAMPLGVIRPAYRWVALAPQAAQERLGAPVFARYAASWERGVALRGWRLDAPARPGATLPITLTWNSLEPVPRPWTVFVHLVDASGEIVAQSNSQPQGGSLPFPLWTPGDWMADQHMLPLPADLPPGAYELRVGLYRPEKAGERQKVWAEDGSALGDLAVVGVVRVGP